MEHGSYGTRLLATRFALGKCFICGDHSGLWRWINSGGFGRTTPVSQTLAEATAKRRGDTRRYEHGERG
jgi:hypothetical protein